MFVLKQSVALTIALFFWTMARAASPMYSIQWESQGQPCLGSVEKRLAGPIASALYRPCAIGKYKPSICPGMLHSGQPWDQSTIAGGGPGITIVGYEVTMILSSSSSQGIMEVGQFGGRAADIVATTSGVGTSTKQGWFPRGVGIINGPKLAKNSHFDVYAACDGTGTFSALVRLYYTSP